MTIIRLILLCLLSLNISLFSSVEVEKLTSFQDNQHIVPKIIARHNAYFKPGNIEPDIQLLYLKYQIQDCASLYQENRENSKDSLIEYLCFLAKKTGIEFDKKFTGVDETSNQQCLLIRAHYLNGLYAIAKQNEKLKNTLCDIVKNSIAWSFWHWRGIINMEIQFSQINLLEHLNEDDAAAKTIQNLKTDFTNKKENAQQKSKYNIEKRFFVNSVHFLENKIEDTINDIKTGLRKLDSINEDLERVLDNSLQCTKEKIKQDMEKYIEEKNEKLQAQLTDLVLRQENNNIISHLKAGSIIKWKEKDQYGLHIRNYFLHGKNAYCINIDALRGREQHQFTICSFLYDYDGNESNIYISHDKSILYLDINNEIYSVPVNTLYNYTFFEAISYLNAVYNGNLEPSFYWIKLQQYSWIIFLGLLIQYKTQYKINLAKLFSVPIKFFKKNDNEYVQLNQSSISYILLAGALLSWCFGNTSIAVIKSDLYNVMFFADRFLE